MLTKTVEIELSPLELATVFCEMDAEQQALFFSHLYGLTMEWEGNIGNQLQAISDSPMLSDGGRFVMGKIGEYSKPQ